jgi:acetyl-CoA carboxylase biotin carboxyl carrier protein
VQYGDALVVLDPAAVAVAETPTVDTAQRAAAGTRNASDGVLRLLAPSSGRYYATPGPGKEPFVRVGEVIATGRTVALLEVMKTFNRVHYGGEGMPERARVLAIVPAPESDLAPGDVILELEPA